VTFRVNSATKVNLRQIGHQHQDGKHHGVERRNVAEYLFNRTRRATRRVVCDLQVGCTRPPESVGILITRVSIDLSPAACQ
jgi:hypothetical protein